MVVTQDSRSHTHIRQCQEDLWLTFWICLCSFRADGSVVTWGCPELGGDSSAVQDQLQDPDVIVGNILEFAAIVDGKIIT